jgi:isocitrate lyase
MKKFLLKQSSKEASGCHSKYVIIELSDAVLRLDNMIWMELDTTDEKKAKFICEAVNEKYEKEKENTEPEQE